MRTYVRAARNRHWSFRSGDVDFFVVVVDDDPVTGMESKEAHACRATRSSEARTITKVHVRTHLNSLLKDVAFERRLLMGF